MLSLFASNLAAGPHGKELCACAGLEDAHPFKIECSAANKARVDEAVKYLETSCTEDREPDEFEWGASFETPDSMYKWVAQAAKKEGVRAWADPEMKFVAFDVASTDADTLFAKRDAANALMKGDCPVKKTGEMLPVGSCVTLEFPTDVKTNFVAPIVTAGVSTVFFTAHMPGEFEFDTHYFMSEDLKTDIEPVSDTGMYCRTDPDGDGLYKCQQEFFILQAHHDNCKHDYLDRYQEELMHVWESKCDKCAIERGYEEGLKECPQIDCSDATVIDSAYYVLSGYQTINKTWKQTTTDGVCVPASFEYAFEWGGVFATPNEAYKWISQAAKDCTDADADCNDDEKEYGFKYADPEMKMALYSVEDATMGYLFRMQDAVDDFMEADDNCKTEVSNGDTLPAPTEKGVCVTLVFPTDPRVDFEVTVPSVDVSHTTFFTGHVPLEFEGGPEGHSQHYLQAMDGEDVEPINQVPMKSSDAHSHDGRRRLSASPESMKQETQEAANTAFAKRRSRRLNSPGSCCNTDPQIGAWKQIVAYHDLCDYDDVPFFVEVGFHDYEQSCEDYFCNAVPSTYDGTTCPSPPSPPPAADDDDGLPAGAIAGIAVAATVAALAICLVGYMITKERAGAPVFATVANEAVGKSNYNGAPPQTEAA